MKAMARALASVAVLGWLCSQATWANEHGISPSVHVPKLGKAPQVDGRLDEPIWKQAAACEGFLLLDGTTAASRATEARLYHDGESLCIGVICRQDNVPIVTHVSPDSKTYLDDSVEVFLDVGCTGESYHHVVLNAADVLLDEINRGEPWTSGLRSDTIRGVGYWSCELVIPFRSIGLKEPTATPIGLNLCRNDIGRKESSSWAGLEGRFHRPDAFGLAVLGSTKDATARYPMEIVRTKPASNGRGVSLAVKVSNPTSEPFEGLLGVLASTPSGDAQDRPIKIPAGQSRDQKIEVRFGPSGMHSVTVLLRSGKALLSGLRTKVGQPAGR